MSKPAEYTRLITGTFDDPFDQDVRPLPEGVHESTVEKGLYYWTDPEKSLPYLNPGDRIQRDDAGKAIAVISAVEFEGRGWSNKDIEFLQGRMKEAKEMLRQGLNSQVISLKLRHDIAKFLSARQLPYPTESEKTNSDA